MCVSPPPLLMTLRDARRPHQNMPRAKVCVCVYSTQTENDPGQKIQRFPPILHARERKEREETMTGLLFIRYSGYLSLSSAMITVTMETSRSMDWKSRGSAFPGSGYPVISRTFPRSIPGLSFVSQLWLDVKTASEISLAPPLRARGFRLSLSYTKCVSRITNQL